MSLTSARTGLMAAFSGIQAVVYEDVPSAPIPPFIACSPGDDWVQPRFIAGTSSPMVAFDIICAVANNDNSAALVNLESLVEDVLQALPNGTVIRTAFQRPNLTQVGPANLLVSNMTVEVSTTL